MKQPEIQNESKEPKEFYEHEGSKDPNYCNHAFTRLSPTRVVCRLCGLGFFDNPFNPFPVDEINKEIANERARQNYHRRKNANKDVEKV